MQTQDDIINAAILDNDFETLQKILSGKTKSGGELGVTVNNRYTPTLLGIDFHNDISSRWKCLYAAMGSGKSTMALMDIIAYYPVRRVLPNILRAGGYVADVNAIAVSQTIDHARKSVTDAIDQLDLSYMAVSGKSRSSNFFFFQYTISEKKVREIMEREGIPIPSVVRPATIRVVLSIAAFSHEKQRSSALSLGRDAVWVIEPIGMEMEDIVTIDRRAGRFKPKTNPPLTIIDGNPPPSTHKIYRLTGIPSERVLGHSDGADRWAPGLKDKSPTGHKEIVKRKFKHWETGEEFESNLTSWWFPSARSEHAINRGNLDKSYYQHILFTGDSSDIRRFIDGLPSYPPMGDRVFSAWGEDGRLRKGSVVIPSSCSVFVACDADTNGGGVLLALMPDGHWIVFGEVSAMHGVAHTPIEFFAKLKDELISTGIITPEHEYYNKTVRVLRGVIEPSGGNRNTTGHTWAGELNKEAKRGGVPIQFSALPVHLFATQSQVAGVANAVLKRRNASNSDRHLLIVSESCMAVREALQSYAWVDRGEGFKLDKGKKALSGVGDAIIAACVGVIGVGTDSAPGQADRDMNAQLRAFRAADRGSRVPTMDEGLAAVESGGTGHISRSVDDLGFMVGGDVDGGEIMTRSRFSRR